MTPALEIWARLMSKAKPHYHLQMVFAVKRHRLIEKLHSLFIQLEKVFENLKPDVAAVETTFVNKDGAATLKLGQARAIALLVPAKAGLAVSEYAPNKVKKAVVGETCR